MKSGTSETSLPKKRGRPKKTELPERALNAVTDEDLALEMELQKMAVELPPEAQEGSNLNLLKKEKIESDLLAEHLENYKPASTVNELLEQVHLAKEVGCDSVEATPQLVKHYCRRHYPDDVGYFMFHDVKVWIAGFHETHKRFDGLTIEQKLFGHSKVK